MHVRLQKCSIWTSYFSNSHPPDWYCWEKTFFSWIIVANSCSVVPTYSINNPTTSINILAFSSSSLIKLLSTLPDQVIWPWKNRSWKQYSSTYSCVRLVFLVMGFLLTTTFIVRCNFRRPVKQGHILNSHYRMVDYWNFSNSPTGCSLINYKHWRTNPTSFNYNARTQAS